MIETWRNGFYKHTAAVCVQVNYLDTMEHE